MIVNVDEQQSKIVLTIHIPAELFYRSFNHQLECDRVAVEEVAAFIQKHFSLATKPELDFNLFQATVKRLGKFLFFDKLNKTLKPIYILEHTIYI